MPTVTPLPPTVDNLKALTDKFFSLHWNDSCIREKPPAWSNRWIFHNEIPNGRKQGVYAFVDQKDMVTYIGVGTSRGSKGYEGHGIGSRFYQAYIRVIDEGKYQPKDKRLEDAGGVMTIGFEPAQAYIANALELFLIARLNTKHNSNRPGA